MSKSAYSSWNQKTAPEIWLKDVKRDNPADPFGVKRPYFSGILLVRGAKLNFKRTCKDQLTKIFNDIIFPQTTLYLESKSWNTNNLPPPLFFCFGGCHCWKLSYFFIFFDGIWRWLLYHFLSAPKPRKGAFTWATKKTWPYFPLNPGCSIGILIMAYYNPYITG